MLPGYAAWKQAAVPDAARPDARLRRALQPLLACAHGHYHPDAAIFAWAWARTHGLSGAKLRIFNMIGGNSESFWQGFAPAAAMA